MALDSDGAFDLICIGSGFASHFFLHRWLARTPDRSRALLLERGPDLDHAAHRANVTPLADHTFENRTPEKPWVYTAAVGGSSNCWVGNTPRMHPSDFRMQTLYGVGRDWPVDYDALEAYYVQAEELMQIAGPTPSPWPRSRAYPQRPHRLNAFDRELARAWPGEMFALPAARPSRPAGSRPRCCASNACQRCPIDSKYTILNGMHVVTRNTRVHLRTGVEVVALDIEGGRVVGVRGRTREGEDYRARGSLVVLGANAIFNAAILLRSAPEDEGPTGRGLSEQASVRVTAHTRGLKNFDGSTYQTGHGYMAHDGPHRRTRAAALLETHNAPRLRNERNRWRDIAHFKLIFEELPQAENRVTVDGDEIPAVEFHRFSENTERGLARAREIAERILAPLPVERIEVSSKRERTEAHIMCTTPMGNRPDTSVVDADLVHHRFRNVLVTGASVFPTAACANPTLTLCALSLRAADRVLS